MPGIEQRGLTEENHIQSREKINALALTQGKR